MHMSASWGLASDDNFVIGVAGKLITDLECVSQENGLFNTWKDLNYAWKTQSPIAGCGPEKKANLQGASRKYNLHGLFQQTMPEGLSCLSRRLVVDITLENIPHILAFAAFEPTCTGCFRNVVKSHIVGFTTQKGSNLPAHLAGLHIIHYRLCHSLSSKGQDLGCAVFRVTP